MKSLLIILPLVVLFSCGNTKKDLNFIIDSGHPIEDSLESEFQNRLAKVVGLQ